MVLEYNVRFGDPETEAMLARYRGDALPLFLGAARGDLEGVQAEWDAPASLCVVIAAEGYPASPRKGDVIEGLADAEAVEGVRVFHAGTSRRGGAIVTNGGRVLTVTAIGRDIDEAAKRAYAGVDRIRFAGARHRRDIGWLERTR
jgi:phosphoribosylamine--glycine ligase